MRINFSQHRAKCVPSVRYLSYALRNYFITVFTIALPFNEYDGFASHLSLIGHYYIAALYSHPIPIVAHRRLAISAN